MRYYFHARYYIPGRKKLRYFIISVLILNFVSFKGHSVEIKCDPVPVAGTDRLEINTIAEKERLPAFCQIKGVLRKRIRFESRLPLQEWNGKFLMAGCGGFCGELLPDKPGFSNSINEALKMGYATIAHDGGHTAPSYDTSWAYDDPEALEIWAHKILPIIAGHGKKIVESFYGRPPALSYFSGCSNGGRLGLMAAQRYPDLFDGILAGGPVFDLSGNAGIHGAWLIQQLHKKDGSLRISREKIPLLKSHVLTQCDLLDGLEDGIISDPRQCQVDLSTLQCDSGKDAVGCLSNNEIALLNKLYRGASNRNGEPLYPGISYGSENYFSTWIIGQPGQPAWGPLAGQGHLNLVYKIAPGQHYAAHEFDFNSEPERLRQKPISRMVDATNADLSVFRRSGAKLIIWHGWSDPLILPQRTIDYYDEVARKSGGMEKTREFARLFMVPGHGHCWRTRAEAPDLFNPIKILEDWVEAGEAPEEMIAYQKDSHGRLIRSRPICAFPAVARYIGGGDVNEAESFVCEH